MKKILKVFAVVLVLIIVFAAIGIIKMLADLNSLEYHKVNMSELADGVYTGKAKTTLVQVEVEVEVENHKITRIDIIKHQNGMGAEAEKITEDIIKNNTYEVDAISGATASSSVIKSAVSDALAK